MSQQGIHMGQKKINLRSQQGLSLVELMVAMVIGVILIGAVLQVFTGSSQTYRLTQANARVQESGRMGLDILSRAIRNAGYYGCAQAISVTNNLRAGPAFNSDFHNIGGAGVDMPNNPAAYNAGTHSLRITGSRSIAAGPKTNQPSVNAANIQISNNDDGLTGGDHVLISDCINADIFEISNINTGGGNIALVANAGAGSPGNDMSANTPPGCSNPNNCLSAEYQAGAQIRRAYSELYFIEDNNQNNPALFLNEGNGRVELVDNIRDMRFRFRTSAGAVVDWQNPMPAGFNFANVVAVDISLLAQSDRSNVIPEAQNVCFPAWAVCNDPADFVANPQNRLLRVYNTTVALRN